MDVRRCGDVDRVDCFILDECFGVVVPVRYIVVPGIIVCEVAIAAHDSGECGVFCSLKAWPTFNFCDVSNADNAPADCAHRYLFREVDDL